MLGAISYGKPTFAGRDDEKVPQKNPASYQLSYIVPPNKVEEHVMNFFQFLVSFCNDLRQDRKFDLCNLPSGFNKISSSSCNVKS